MKSKGAVVFGLWSLVKLSKHQFYDLDKKGKKLFLFLDD